MTAAVRTPRAIGPRAVAVIAGLLALAVVAAALPASADASKRARTRLTLPDDGQLAAARLAFAVGGVEKPKIRVRAANAGKLPDDVVIAAQAARSKNKAGRAVALIGIANPAEAGSPRREGSARVTASQVIVEAKIATVTRSFSGIVFDNLPSQSRNFLSVLGTEPNSERALAQKVLDLPEEKIPDDDAGRIDLSRAAGVMRLKLIGDPKLIVAPTLDLIDPDHLVTAAIAGAVGPPAAIDAEIWGLITRAPIPQFVSGGASPSPSDPNVVFASGQWSTPIAGFQISQATDNALVLNQAARCQNSAFADGTLTSGPGPFLRRGLLSVRLTCQLTAPDSVFFVDIPFNRPTSAGELLARLLPFTISDPGPPGLGEPLSVDPSTFAIKY